MVFSFGCGWRDHSRHPCLLPLGQNLNPVFLFEAALDRLALLSLDDHLDRVAFAFELNRDREMLVHFHFL